LKKQANEASMQCEKAVKAEAAAVNKLKLRCESEDKNIALIQQCHQREKAR